MVDETVFGGKAVVRTMGGGIAGRVEEGGTGAMGGSGEAEHLRWATGVIRGYLS